MIPTSGQAYSPSIGIGTIPQFLFRDRDPTVYDVEPSWQKYTAWVNTTTKAIWYLESVSSSNAVVTALWRAVGPIVVAATGPTAPLTASPDYAYPIGQTWCDSTANDYYVMMSNPTSTTGYWIKLSAGTQGVDLFAMQTGTTPIGPDSSGIVTFSGATVAAGTNPVRTDGTASTTMTLEVQTSQAIATTDATKIGLCNFNSAHFSCDANGFVGLLGGSLAVDSFAMQTGTSPVVPASPTGLVTFNGAVVAAGTNPVRTDGTGANTMTLEVQTSQALATTDATKIGLCNFYNNQFAVDANGFVTLTGLSSAIPAFNVVMQNDVLNVTGDGTAYTVIFDTVSFDQTSSITIGGTTFTVPTTGKYYLHLNITLNGLDATHNNLEMNIFTATGISYFCNPGVIRNPSGSATFSIGAFQSLTAAQTITCQVLVSGGARTVGIENGAGGNTSSWAGYLVC